MNTSALAQKIRLGLIALLCLLALGAEVAEYELFEHLKTNEKTFASNELASIGQLKAGQLSAFLKERRGDGLVLTDLLRIGLPQRWWTASDTALPALLQQPIKSAVMHYDYTGAMILDAKGNIRFRIGRSMGLSEATQSFVRKELQRSPPPFSELYAADPAASGQLILDTFAPIKSADKTKTLGVLVLRGDWPSLFTMIQAWPVESRSTETLLIRQDKTQVTLINEPRDKTQSTLKSFKPIKIDANAPPWPIVKAAQGQYGPMESIDYRGQAVMAHILPVPGTSWNMVVKVDTEEVLGHLRFLQSIMAAGTLIIAVGAGLGGYRWQRKQERARALREAQHIEHRLAAIIDSATDAIISVDEDQRIILFNPTAEQLFKCAAQDALGQPLDRFIPHRFRNTHHAQVQAFGMAGTTTRKMGTLGAINGLRTDGQEFPIEASISQTQTDGHTLYTVILRDITERRAAENALQINQTAIDSSINGIAMAGLDGKITYANRAFLTLWQLERPEQVLGHLPVEFVPDAPMIIERMLRDGAWQGEVTGLRHDGSRMGLQLSAHTVTDAAGRPVVLMASFLDITERKQAEDRVAEANAMLNLILNNIPLYVFWKDRTSTYLGSNQLFAQAAGLRDPQALIGQTDFDLAWKDSANAYRADDRTVMETNTPKLNFEEPQTRPDGSVLWINTSKVPLQDREGKVFGLLGIYADITERKQSEDALRFSEERLKEAQRIGKLGFLDLDVSTSTIILSDETTRLLGFDGDKPTPTLEDVINLLHPDDRARVEQSLQSAMAGTAKHDLEHRIVRPDGREIWVSTGAELLRDQDGKPTRLLGTVLDITESKRNQELLAKSAQFLKEAQRLAQIGSWELDLDSSTLTWSDEIFRIFEIDPAKFNASYDAFLSAVHPEDRDLINETYRASVETRAPYEIVHRLLMADGRVKHVQEHGQTFYDESTGQPLRSTGTVQDLTALKQAELALTQSESLFRTLATVAPVGIFRTDAAGHCLYVNDRWCAITGLSADRAAEYGWTTALHQDDRTRVAEEWAQSVQNRQPFRSEYRFCTTDQRETWVVGQAQAELDQDGHVLGYVGTITDISERKQVELRIETSLHEKETLLREVHHRVKNNLQIISSLLHFQAKKAQHEIELTALHEGQDRLRAMILVHELLYRSTDLHRISLGEYLTTLTDQLHRSFRDATAHVRLQIETDDLSVPATIALPCGMIVTELMTNAFKYAYPAGATGPLVIRIATGEQSFLLSVSDEGVGLPAEFDLKQTSSFGLHLVANLADQLGATLTRPPGVGTTIVLAVPLPASAVQPEPPMGAPAQPLHRSESRL